jgi:hypothetical protein
MILYAIKSQYIPKNIDKIKTLCIIKRTVHKMLDDLEVYYVKRIAL